LLAAVRPALARTVAGVVGSVGVLLLVTAAVDLIHGGRTTVSDEAPHLLWLVACGALLTMPGPPPAGAPEQPGTGPVTPPPPPPPRRAPPDTPPRPPTGRREPPRPRPRGGRHVRSWRARQPVPPVARARLRAARRRPLDGRVAAVPAPRRSAFRRRPHPGDVP